MHEKLKQVRESAGLSHADLFHKTNVQAHQIKLYEAGQKDFMANTLVKLFNACGCDLYVAKVQHGEGEE